MQQNVFQVHPAASLAAREAGAGTPLLLVHGSVGDMTDFRRVERELSTRFHAIAYSRRFHPPNRPPSAGEQYSMSVHAADLLQVLQRTGRAHIVGISWGGYAALSAALEQPELFLSLMLAEPPVLPALTRSAGGRGLLEAFLTSAIRPAREAFRAGDGDRGIAFFMDGILGRTGAFEALPSVVRNELRRYIPELALELTTPFELYMPDLPDERLAGMRVPVLLLEGSRSPVMFGVILDHLERTLPRTSRARVPDAGHAMHLANPDGFLQCVRQFLERREHPGS